MAYYITIDGGTTNTRAVLINNGNIISSLKIPIGAGSYGEKAEYISAIRDGIRRLLDSNGLCDNQIECIIASGMITSEKGLYELGHLTAPVGLRELHRGMKRLFLPEITDIPFCFIPGVKTASADLSECDMMRGEETELFGLCDNIRPNCMYVLPGSHSKLILTDSEGRISAFKTMLTGEMLAALSKHTILKNSVDLNETSLNSELLLQGYRYADENGLNEALFKVRILKNLLGADSSQTYSFFLGAVLQGEIKQILSTDVNEIVIGGKSTLRLSMLELLRRLTDIPLTDALERSDTATAMGAVMIYNLAQ